MKSFMENQGILYDLIANIQTLKNNNKLDIAKEIEAPINPSNGVKIKLKIIKKIATDIVSNESFSVFSA